MVRSLCSLGTVVREGKGGSCGWVRGLAYLVLLNLVGFEEPCLKVNTCWLSMVWAEVGEGSG